MSETTAAELILSPSWVDWSSCFCSSSLCGISADSHTCRSVREVCLLIFFEVMGSQLARYKDEKYETLPLSFSGTPFLRAPHNEQTRIKSFNIFYASCLLWCNHQPLITRSTCVEQRDAFSRTPGADGEVKGLAQWPTVRQMKMVQIWALHLSHPIFVVTVRVFKPVTSRSQTRLLYHWKDSVFLNEMMQRRKMRETVIRRCISGSFPVRLRFVLWGWPSGRKYTSLVSVSNMKKTHLYFLMWQFIETLKHPSTFHQNVSWLTNFYKWFSSIILQDLRQLNKKITLQIPSLVRCSCHRAAI